MSERYKVSVRIVSQKGTCNLGHKVGQEWIVKDGTPEGICLGAAVVLIPDIRVLMYGGSFPWSNDPDSNIIACPDAANPVVFEIRRIRE